jgi:hypothetical protein
MNLSDRFDTRTSFIDMLLSGQMNLFILLIMAMAMINPESDKKGDVDLKAEMFMSVSWTENLDCDVDTWVRAPNGMVLSYLSRDMGFLHLDRDDTGVLNDKVQVAGVTKTNPINAEYTTVRQVVPGEYVVNVQLFACRDPEGNDVPPGPIDPLPVSIVLTDLNPKATLAGKKEVVFTRMYEESHVFRFTVDSQGVVTRVWSEPANIVTFSRGQ